MDGRSGGSLTLRRRTRLPLPLPLQGIRAGAASLLDNGVGAVMGNAVTGVACWRLMNACEAGRLGSESYKRINFGLIAYGSLRVRALRSSITRAVPFCSILLLLLLLLLLVGRHLDVQNKVSHTTGPCTFSIALPSLRRYLVWRRSSFPFQ